MPLRALPSTGPFFATRLQRIALARERYFESGEMPSGLVSDAVLQSWGRCLRARRAPAERAAFDPVTASRAHHTLSRNRALLESAQPVLRELASAIQGTGCVYVLTDEQGVVIDASRRANANGLTPLITRVGVNLGEQEIGTSAPGIVAKTGAACAVHGAEHFFQNIHNMYCAAAPIREASGALTAVLDISIENAELPFDVPTLVGMYATGIENRLLVARSASPLLLRLQVNPTLFGTPFEGLVAVEPDGSVPWMNTAADRLLRGAAPRGTEQPVVDDLLGQSFDTLTAVAHGGTARLFRATNGLGIWVSAQLLASDGLRGTRVSLGEPAPPASGAGPAPHEAHDTPAPAMADTPVSLRAASRQAIEQALAAASGNVSKAARALGVSRGLLYRHLRQQDESPPAEDGV